MERVKKPRRNTSVSARKETCEAPVSQPVVDQEQLADEKANALAQGSPLVPRDLSLTVKLSRQLHSKLLHAAQEEGVPLEALVQELLAEGATLRAWEIIERKYAMRGQTGNHSVPSGGDGGHRGNFNSQFNNQRHPQGGRSGAHHGGRGQGGNRVPSGTAWMDDKAAFLEYVRNQEKRRR